MTTQTRPPERWRKIRSVFMAPVRYSPDADIYDLVVNILDPEAPELIDPTDPFQCRSTLNRALHPRGEYPPIEIGQQQAKLLAWYLFTETFASLGIYWRDHSIASLGHLRHALAEAHRWSFTQVAEKTGLRKGNVSNQIWTIVRKFQSLRSFQTGQPYPGVSRPEDLRKVVDKGLQAEMLRILGRW